MLSIKAPIAGWDIFEHFSHQRGSDLHLLCDRYGLQHMIGQAGNVLIGLKQNCDEKLLKFAVMFVDGVKDGLLRLQPLTSTGWSVYEGFTTHQL